MQPSPLYHDTFDRQRRPDHPTLIVGDDLPPAGVHGVQFRGAPAVHPVNSRHDRHAHRSTIQADAAAPQPFGDSSEAGLLQAAQRERTGLLATGFYLGAAAVLLSHCSGPDLVTATCAGSIRAVTLHIGAPRYV
ncbi:MAG: hypothetical protein ACYDD1_14875 [Caulobacteraceae bacterium]